MAQDEKTEDLIAKPRRPDNAMICDNYIDGQYVPPTAQCYIDVKSPHAGTTIGKVAMSTAPDINAAVNAAQAAYDKWRKYTVKERVKFILTLRQIIEENEDELAELIMLEHGKNRAEALGSIRKGNETVQYACGMPNIICGKILEVSNGVRCTEFYEPHGVCVSIVPFNFPLMVPMWTLPIAIACGNTYILKPSEKVPLTCSKFAEYIAAAGFPQGVIQIINGGATAVNALIDHANVSTVSFVGSTKVAQLVYNRCKSMKIPKRCLALGGAKNHLVAVPDCNIAMTSTDIVNSFCGCAGQRCMAASVLLLCGGEQKQLLAEVVRKAAEIVPGIEKREMGPIIDEGSLQRIKSFIDEAEKDGHKILLDGRTWIGKYGKKTKGNWFGPTVVLFNDAKHRGMTDEIFGPVISVYVCKSKEEAIEIENANGYGNAACIYTSTGENALWFQKRFSAGMIGVNVGVPVPREPFAFGGINASKFGDNDITADGAINFFTWRRKVTTKWTPPEVKTWLN